jgi:hypothetical protein
LRTGLLERITHSVLAPITTPSSKSGRRPDLAVGAFN